MTTVPKDGATIEHVIGRRGEIVLRVHAGDVTIHATDDDIVRIRDVDGRDLDDRFAVDRGDERVVVRPRDRALFDLGGRRPRAASRLVVEAPRAARLSVDTASADLRADALEGEQSYRTASGEIQLTRASGPIAIDAVSGSIEIDAIGPVDLSGRLVSGDLRIRGGVVRTVALATTSGDCDLAAPLVGPGPYSIQTVSGDVRVVAARDGLRVEARTVTGELTADPAHRSESGAGQRILVVGGGGSTLSFRSISGDLRVVSGALGGIVSPVPPAPVAAPEPPEPPVAAPRPAPVVVEGRPADDGSGEQADDVRLAVLRELEAGAIDVATATERLAALEADDGE